MFRLTWILFALFSLILPILSAPVPTPEDMELENRAAAATHSGRGTWYQPGLGSCGKVDNAGEMIVALSESLMGSPPRYCGKTITITSNGKTASATAVDSCPGCGPGDLDMSPALFRHFAAQSVGVISVKWNM